jgi:hypothetical protein
MIFICGITIAALHVVRKWRKEKNSITNPAEYIRAMKSLREYCCATVAIISGILRMRHWKYRAGAFDIFGTYTEMQARKKNENHLTMARSEVAYCRLDY